MTTSENVLIRRVRTLASLAEADPLTDFSRPWEPERAVPSTAFRGGHDGEVFAFRFDVEDSDIVLGEAPDEGDRVMGSDRVEIFFSTDEALSRYYGLEVDPRGNILDYSARHYRKFDRAWCFPGLSVKAAIVENGYAVSGQIPLANLRELDLLKPDGTAIAGIFRAEFSHLPDGTVEQDWMPWIDPQTESPDFHVPEAFGRMIFEDL